MNKRVVVQKKPTANKLHKLRSIRQNTILRLIKDIVSDSNDSISSNTENSSNGTPVRIKRTDKEINLKVPHPNRGCDSWLRMMRNMKGKVKVNISKLLDQFKDAEQNNQTKGYKDAFINILSLTQSRNLDPKPLPFLNSDLKRKSQVHFNDSSPKQNVKPAKQVSKKKKVEFKIIDNVIAHGIQNSNELYPK